MSGQTRWLIAAAVLSAGVGFGSFHAWRRLGPAAMVATESHALPVARVDQPAAGADDAGDAPAPAVIPDLIPDLSLPDLKGRQHALASYLGRPTIFNFWASWCAPCRREIPLLNEIRHAATANDVQVVGIAADLETNVVEFLKKTQIDYEVLVGERQGSEAAARFGVPLVLPFSVFVSAGGHVVAVKVGELHRDEAMDMLAAIRELDLGKRDLAGTRQQIAARLRELAVERAKQSAASTG
jgi:thiol-disulfide isomerase/thioredoxin